MIAYDCLFGIRKTGRIGMRKYCKKYESGSNSIFRKGPRRGKYVNDNEKETDNE